MARIYEGVEVNGVWQFGKRDAKALRGDKLAKWLIGAWLATAALAGAALWVVG